MYSTLMHVFRHLPPQKEALDANLRAMQAELDSMILGKMHGVAAATAHQRWQDGGLGHPHLRARMEAMWAKRVRELLEPEDRPGSRVCVV